MKVLQLVGLLVLVATAVTATNNSPQQQHHKHHPSHKHHKNLYHVQAPRSVLQKALDPQAIDIWNLRAAKPDNEHDDWVEADIYTTPQEIQLLDEYQRSLHAKATKGHHGHHKQSSHGHSHPRSWYTLKKQFDEVEDMIAKDRQEIEACLARTATEFTPDQLIALEQYTKSDFFDCFRPADQMLQFLDALVNATDNEVLTKIDEVATSYEGEAIPAYKLSTSDESSDIDKPAVYVQSLIHAREYISGTSVTMTIASLLDALNADDKKIGSLLEQVDFYFVPITNPDGYRYTWTDDRMWRKNRRLNDSHGHVFDGIDLNRNFGSEELFNLDNVTDITDEVFPGEEPLSEPSTAGIWEFLDQLDTLAGVIDVHSFGGLVLRPFSYQKEAPPEPYGSMMKALADNVRDAINANGALSEYVSQKSMDLYPAYGCFDDSVFVAHDFEVPAITIEVEGEDFVADQTTIRPIGKSMAAGILQFAKEAVTYWEALQEEDPNQQD